MTARRLAEAARHRVDGGTDFLITLAVTFLAITSTNAIRPTVTYRALDLGAGPVEVGLVQSAFSVLPVLTAVMVGRRIDRSGEGRYLAGAVGLLAAGSAAAALVDSLPLLAVSQMIMGFGAITLLIAGQALVGNRGRRERRDQRYGIYATVMSLGQLAGPVAAGSILSVASEQVVFGAAAALSFAGLAVALLVVRSAGDLRRDEEPASSRPAGGTGGMRDATRRVMRREGMPAAMLVSIVVISSVDLLVAYLPVYGEQAGLSAALVGALLAVRAGAALVSRLFMGRLVVAFGRPRVLTSSVGLLAVGIASVPLTSLPWLLVGSMILAGVGFGLAQPLTISWVADRSPRADRATALGVRLTGNRAALLVVPAIMGAIASAVGVAMIFYSTAAFLAGGVLAARSVATGDRSEQGTRAEEPTGRAAQAGAGDPSAPGSKTS